MNCLEFCRQQQADPYHLSQVARQHVADCDACQAFAARTHKLDEILMQPINRVPVPAGLNERILLRHQLSRNSYWLRGAFAAGVLICLATVLSLPWLRYDGNLARVALAHVKEEPDTFRAQQTVSDTLLVAAFASVGAQLHGNIGHVTYLGTCPLPGGEGKHLVVSSPLGRYSLILMPAQAKVRKMSEDGAHAAIAKPAAHGTYAIVASATPDIIKIEKLLDQNVNWTNNQ